MPLIPNLPLLGATAIPTGLVLGTFGVVARVTPPSTSSVDFYSTSGQIFAGLLIAVAVESGAKLRANERAQAELAMVHVSLGLAFVFTVLGGGVVVGTLLDDSVAQADVANVVTGSLAAASISIAIPFIATWLRVHGQVSRASQGP